MNTYLKLIEEVEEGLIADDYEYFYKISDLKKSKAEKV